LTALLNLAVFNPNLRIQSDEEALEDARREAAGLPPLNRRRAYREEVASDEMVYERFKKRQVQSLGSGLIGVWLTDSVSLKDSQELVCHDKLAIEELATSFVASL
jgi:hypothetical protein